MRPQLVFSEAILTFEDLFIAVKKREWSDLIIWPLSPRHPLKMGWVEDELLVSGQCHPVVFTHTPLPWPLCCLQVSCGYIALLTKCNCSVLLIGHWGRWCAGADINTGIFRNFASWSISCKTYYKYLEIGCRGSSLCYKNQLTEMLQIGFSFFYFLIVLVIEYLTVQGTTGHWK